MFLLKEEYFQAGKIQITIIFNNKNQQNMNKRTNGVASLPDAAEEMRMQVVELELRARYWKAQYEVRHYTLEAEKVQPEYDLWLEGQKTKNEEAQKRFEESLKELQEKGADINVDGSPISLTSKTETNETV